MRMSSVSLLFCAMSVLPSELPAQQQGDWPLCGILALDSLASVRSAVRIQTWRKEALGSAGPRSDGLARHNAERHCISVGGIHRFRSRFPEAANCTERHALAPARRQTSPQSCGGGCGELAAAALCGQQPADLSDAWMATIWAAPCDPIGLAARGRSPGSATIDPRVARYSAAVSADPGHAPKCEMSVAGPKWRRRDFCGRDAQADVSVAIATGRRRAAAPRASGLPLSMFSAPMPTGEGAGKEATRKPVSDCAATCPRRESNSHEVALGGF